MSEQLVFQAFTRGNRMEWLTATGLNEAVVNADQPLTAEDEVTLALHISALGDSAAWARGDLALYVREKVKRYVEANNLDRAEYNRRWGEELERLAKLLGVTTKTLYNNITACAAWPHEARRNTLSVRYKHHELLGASMPLEDRVRMLEQADSEGWNYKRFYAVVHGHTLADSGEPTETYRPPVQPAGDPADPTNGYQEDDIEFFDGEDEGAYDESCTENGTSRGFADDFFDQPLSSTVSVHMVDSAGAVDVIVSDANEGHKLIYSFSNGQTWEIAPDLRTGSLNIRRVELAGT